MKTRVEQLEAIIEKQDEFIKFLQRKIAGIISNSEYITGDVIFRKEINELKSQREIPEKYEPYCGWCDVGRCKNEGCSGGVAWRETGY